MQIAKKFALSVLPICLVAGAASGCSKDKDKAQFTQDELCDELLAIDPGQSFAGGVVADIATAAVRVDEAVDRVPEELEPAFRVIAQKVEDEPEIADLPGLDQADEDYGPAFQATYALGFDRQVGVAAALLERYGVDECGLEASGLFNIDAVRDSDLDAEAIPALTQEDLEALKVEFDPATLEGFELKPFEIPEVEFKEDLSQFELEVPNIPTPNLEN